MFRFTIRDVLWLTVVVALAVMLWLQSAKLNEVQRKNASLQQRIGRLKYIMKDEFLVDVQERDGGGFSISRSDELPKRITEGKGIIGRFPATPLNPKPSSTDNDQ